MATRDYLLRLPRDVTVVAACEDALCEAWQFGWETTIDEVTPLGTFQAAYIRESSGRSFREMRTEAGLTVFRFGPRQRCFAEHRTRRARWLIRAGRAVREVPVMADWTGDLSDHVSQLEEQARRG
jgi:hypothetical protein